VTIEHVMMRVVNLMRSLSYFEQKRPAWDEIYFLQFFPRIRPVQRELLAQIKIDILIT